MKLEAILGTMLLGSLIACSGADDKPADAAAQPAAATAPNTTTDETSPSSDTTAASNTSADPAPATTDPAPTTTPPEPVVQTCETLAVAAPAGKLTDVTAVTGMYKINPVDVYATEDEDGLHLVLTETPSACLYHSNNFQASKMNELTIDFPKTGDAFAPGTFKPSGFNQETGNVCSADDGQFNGIGTAWGGGSASGKLTITSKTDTLVEGTVAINTAKGKNTFTFSAPICAKPAQDAELTCCAGAE